jgi:hypothetical protein
MNSQLLKALKLKMQPVAILLTDNKPENGLHFKGRKQWWVGRKPGRRVGCAF